MADVQFPASPVENDEFITGGKTYIFKSGGWRAKPLTLSDVASSGVHEDLTGRSEPDQHPISAITNLDSSINTIYQTFVPNVSVGTASTNTVYYEDGYLEASLGFLDWQQKDVSYNVDTSIYNLNDILVSNVTSNYIEVTALLGVRYDTPGKKVSLGAIRIAEFLIHMDANGGLHGANIKSQHSGVYGKYFDDWANTPEMHDVKPEQISIFFQTPYIYIHHNFGVDESITPTIRCKYIMKIKQLELEITT